MKLRWRRALVKLSGELIGGRGGALDAGGLRFYAREVGTARDAGARIALVIGGGNVARGSALPHLPPTAGHTIGILGTLINGVALREALAEAGIPSLLMSALPCPGVAEAVDPWRARAALEEGQIVLFAAGTGNPFVTTDTAAVIRALTVGAEVVLKGSKVDGIYATDPQTDPTTQPLPRLTHREYLTRGLRAMDGAAVAIAADHELPIVVYRADREGSLLCALRGEIGSLIA
ncbi:UMP kinase [Candidatus Bipolaricaulota bacterium]|nr:UMP kinase [Candidatus Bipolaricaulota bacterium]